MNSEPKGRMVVEFVHRISNRPWIFVSGRLEGAELRVGDQVQVRVPGGPNLPATVKTIELHGPPGITTLGLDDPLIDLVKVGSIITIQ